MFGINVCTIVAKLTTLIAINICYPRVPPLFIISVNNGASGAFTSDNDLNIKVRQTRTFGLCKKCSLYGDADA